jgi:Spy/CpxP family protein refolding chaperone
MNVKQALIAGAASLLVIGGLAAAQPYGMGPGGYGMGQGYGMGSGYGLGPGMMMGPGYGNPGMGWGDEAYAGLNLTPEQRRKIADIRQETSKAVWQLMGTMHEQGYHMYGMFGPGATDDDAARKAYESMAASQKAMFELQLEARRKIDAVLTDEQREQLRRYWKGR